MNRQSILLMMFGFILVCSTAFAGLNDYKAANRQTAFNNVTDYIATVGKSEEDKKEIIRDRREKRRLQRFKDENSRKKAETRKLMKAQREAIIRKENAQ